MVLAFDGGLLWHGEGTGEPLEAHGFGARDGEFEKDGLSPFDFDDGAFEGVEMWDGLRSVGVFEILRLHETI